MSTKEIAKRYVLFIISLFFAALGVAVTKHGELGVSPISSVANVMSGKFEAVSLGYWLILWNSVLILGQIVILRREFKMIELLQIPLSFLFGWFTNFRMYCVSNIPADGYMSRIAMVICGTVILGFGVSLSVIANVIMNSGEAFVRAISDKSGAAFGNVKIGFDICCVMVSLILSMALFGGKIIGTREGTIITALLTGCVVKFFVGWLEKPINGILADKESVRGK